MKNLIRVKKLSGAFTLIELLIVVAIIALLAAILFPVFSRARENARRTTCLNNLKQLGMGSMQYNQDYDERYPKVRGDAAGISNWGQALYPYIKSGQVYACPSNNDTNKTTLNWNDTTLGAVQVVRSYGMNKRLEYANHVAILSASQKILIGELYKYGPEMGDRGWNGTEFSTRSFAKHLGTWNVVFVDGHAKSMRPVETMIPLNMWGRFDGQVTADGFECGTSPNKESLNCDKPFAPALADLGVLQQNSQ